MSSGNFGVGGFTLLKLAAQRVQEGWAEVDEIERPCDFLYDLTLVEANTVTGLGMAAVVDMAALGLANKGNFASGTDQESTEAIGVSTPPASG